MSGKPNNIRAWITERVDALARWDRTRFVRDVFAEPSIGPVAAWLISGLVTLVAWLTQQYAPGAIERAADGVQGEGGGIIPISMGYWTLGAVGVVTLIAATQPIIAAQIRAALMRPLASGFSRLHIVLRAPFELVWLIPSAIYRLPAWAFSAADYLLARPVALLAGAGLRRWWLRYGVFLVWMAASLASAWLWPAPYGLYAFSFGALLIIGVIRRWNWVEVDREAFFVARKHDPDTERVGFAEDLRDEALIALLFLLLLIPLALRQIDLAWPDTFIIGGADGDDASVPAWLGFFGAEMAKSVPFVDWSEVFHVANGSPIEPDTVMGAQVVFAMRAALDLIMIAAVLQAIQLGSRLSEQARAFADRKVDILEPFTERARLAELGRELGRAEEGLVLRHNALREFPPYSPERLKQIVDGGTDERPVQAAADPAARRAALALATKQAVAVERPEEATPLINAASGDSIEANRQLALRLAAESVPAALMRPAYAQAKESMAKSGAVDVNALLQAYPEQARPLARRAIRSALGELDEMVRIPAGKFMMGAPEGEEGAGSDERPPHPVQVVAFEIGKYAVTFEEFDAFCEATGYWRRQQRADEVVPPDQNWGRDKRPVINISWYDAKAYIDWLNSWSDGGFRLPSEAEWEYACRKDTTTRWSFGDDETQLEKYAWFEGNSERKTHPVGEKLPNGFGLHDMHGNVWEWVEDPWHGTYKGAPDDGSVWSADGDTSSRVLRGGSRSLDPRNLRSANRFRSGPTYRDFFIGFRLARTVFTS